MSLCGGLPVRSIRSFSFPFLLLWLAVIIGEVANFAAYAFAPAILVTPLGALSIIVSAAIAHVILKEKLHILGMVRCVLCVIGSTTIVLHAPPERDIESVKVVWQLATEPAFLLYATLVVAVASVLVLRFVPQWAHSGSDLHWIMFLGGLLLSKKDVVMLVLRLLLLHKQVMSAKALGIGLKLTFEGVNQLLYPQTWVFAMVLSACVIVQMNYLNRALDTFNTAVVSPIYYVMFTSLTIVASVIMFKDWDRQNPSQIVTELCGFVTILAGTYLLHVTKDHCEPVPSLGSFKGALYNGLPLKHEEEQEMAEQLPLRRAP